MKIHVSKKLGAGELEGLKGTLTYENLMKNKICIYSNTMEDDTIFDLVSHFDEYGQGLLYMSTLGSDNIWRIYFENTGDMLTFIELARAPSKKPDNIGTIESVVVNTTHDTE
jgi:hypothetical protein